MEDMEDRDILNIMDYIGRPLGRYPKSFLLISLMKVCQEWGGQKGDIWTKSRISDQGHG